ncbi:LysR family transcriptional regulator [Blastopirellula marina]|uniref:LysR family transcriptional regulator n=1 Tax=Blastopirellula marina TaxID=124 RepID=A0A2S8GPA8_9BACT|nr:hydrogen peroxide-inducible genes activator [Blastopirellula marina]PQO46257.1 LysR family transcriptional regulator [Blastopirellula marina]
MEIHQLRYFVAVAELENFTRAAQQCHVTQPSLSQQIAKLERQLGTRLLDRLGRTVVLTDSGKELLPRARRILKEVDSAESWFQQPEGPPASSLKLGALPTIAPFLLPRVISHFRDELPQVALTIVEDYTDHLLDRLLKGTLDVAVMALPIDDPRFEVEPLFREGLLVALPPNHPLADKPTLTFNQVRQEPFVLLHEVHCLGEQILGFCRQQEFQPRVVCESAQISTIQEMIRLGLGISLLPEMAIDTADDSIVYRPIRKLQPYRTIVATWNRHRTSTPPQARLLDILRQEETID